MERILINISLPGKLVLDRHVVVHVDFLAGLKLAGPS